MKILLDHNQDWRLSRYLTDHEVKSARQQGWEEFRNGELLTIAEAEGFQVMLTGDTNVNYQQNFSFRSISLIVLRAHNNKRQTHIEMCQMSVKRFSPYNRGESSKSFING